MKGVEAMIYFSIIARVWLGSMFLYAAGLKLVWYDQNGCHINAYQLIPESLATTVGFLLVTAESLAGITLLTGWFFPLGPTLGALLGATFAYTSSTVLLRKADVQCGCAGNSSSRVNLTSLIRGLSIIIFSISIFLLDKRGGVLLSPALIFLVTLISLLPAGFALFGRIRNTKLFKQRMQRDEEEITRLTQLLTTQPSQ